MRYFILATILLASGGQANAQSKALLEDVSTIIRAVLSQDARQMRGVNSTLTRIVRKHGGTIGEKESRFEVEDMMVTISYYPDSAIQVTGEVRFAHNDYKVREWFNAFRRSVLPTGGAIVRDDQSPRHRSWETMNGNCRTEIYSRGRRDLDLRYASGEAGIGYDLGEVEKCVRGGAQLSYTEQNSMFAFSVYSR